MRRRLTAFLQLCLGLGIIAFIIAALHRRGDLSAVSEAFGKAAESWPLLAVAFLLFGVALLLCMKRWELILRSLGHELQFGKIAALSMVGQFFNSFLLGATGGDIAKAYYAARETRHRRTEIVTTVFIDRLTGLLALLVLAVIVMLARIRFFLSAPEMRAAFFVYAAFLAASAPILAIFFRRDIFERWPLLAAFEARTSAGATLGKMYRAFRLCLGHPPLVLGTVLLSLGNHVCALAAAFYAGMALGLGLGFPDYAAAFLVINAVSSIPFTPSGLGTRETACILLLGGMGVPASHAVSLSLTIYAVAAVWSLIGGVVYLFYSAGHGRVGDVVTGQ